MPLNVQQMLAESLPIVALTVGLAQQVKAGLRITDGAALLATVLVGLVLSAGLDYATANPVGGPAWVLVALHGLVNGVAAAGSYKLIMAHAVVSAGESAPTAPDPSKQAPPQ